MIITLPAMWARMSAQLAAWTLCLMVGCGGSESGASGEGAPDPNDKRAVAIDCITNDAGLPAQPTGEKSIQVGGPGGARIEFFLSTGEAESQQFKGEAQGAEQVGSTLLFVGRAGDEELEKIEECLHEL